jgi:hypothetical protein
MGQAPFFGLFRRPCKRRSLSVPFPRGGTPPVTLAAIPPIVSPRHDCEIRSGGCFFHPVFGRRRNGRIRDQDENPEPGGGLRPVSGLVWIILGKYGRKVAHLWTPCRQDRPLSPGRPRVRPVYSEKWGVLLTDLRYLPPRIEFNGGGNEPVGPVGPDVIGQGRGAVDGGKPQGRLDAVFAHPDIGTA